MASTYSNLKFELIGTGDQSGAWGTTTNTNLGTAIEQALVGMATISSGFVTNSLTLTLTDTNAAQNARALVLNLTQALSGAGTLNVPAIQKPYMIINATGQTVTVKVTGLTGVAVPNGTRAFLYNNGTDVGDFFNYASSLTLGTDLAVADGGTGASTACGARTNLGLGTIATQPASNVNISGGSITGITDLAVADGGTGASSAPVARTNLGATTVGGNLFTLTNPSAITFVRINADNTVSALPAACFRTAIGAGTGSGSVTSVATSGSINGLTLTGGPITSSGTVTLGGGVNVSTITTGTLPIAYGGTGTTSTTFANLTTNVTGTLPVANGGTGAATFTANNVLLGNGTSAFQVVAAGTSGNVLTSNGTTWTSAAVAAGGANIQTFTAGGTYTKPPGAKFVYVEMWGAGGGGSSSTVYNACRNVGGGGGGYTYKMFAAPAVGATETVTIGAGGAGGSPSPSEPVYTGARGGTTNFGTLLYAYGGGGARQNNAGAGGGVWNGTQTCGTPALVLFGCGKSCNYVPSPGQAGVWAGGSGFGGISMFGGGGGGASGSQTPPTSGTRGGAGRVFGSSSPLIVTSPSPVTAYYSGGGGAGGTAGNPGSSGTSFNGGGGGGAGVGPGTPGGAGGNGGTAAGGGGGGSGNIDFLITTGAGGTGGNGYMVVYTWG